MPIPDTPSRYGSLTKAFHWLTALLILMMIPLGLIAHSMSEILQDPTLLHTAQDITRTALLFSIHKTLGLTLLVLALVRITWAITQPKPAPFPTSKAQSLLAGIVYWLLYTTLILVPLSGWAHHAATSGFAPIWGPFPQSLPFIPQSPTLASIFASLHAILISLMMLSILLHISGALKHHLLDKDATLHRMLPGSDPKTATTTTTSPPKRLPAIIAALILLAAIGIGLTRQPSHDTSPPPTHSTSASNWSVTNGRLDLTVTLFGSPLAGTFTDWSADITFTNPPTPGPAGHVSVSINIASLTLGSVSDQAMGPDYFDAEHYPTAHFSADITKTKTGYFATGPLTIRDKTVQISLPFNLTLQNSRAEMIASIPLNRRDFAIAKRLSDENTLAFATQINISLIAQQQPLNAK